MPISAALTRARVDAVAFAVIARGAGTNGEATFVMTGDILRAPPQGR